MRGAARTVLLALACSLSGCMASGNEQDRKVAEGLDVPDAFPLFGEAAAASPLMGKPTALGQTGSELWVGDFAGDPYLHVFDIGTGVLLRSFGRSGDGPGDLLSLVTMMRRPGDSTGIWVHDMSLRRLTRFDRDPAVPPAVIRFERAAFSFTWVTPDLLAGADGWDSTRVIFFDTTGRVLRTVPGPMLGADSISRSARHGATVRVSLCTSPDGRVIAAVHQRAGRIDFFDPDSGYTGSADTPVRTEPVFRPGRRSGEWTSEGQPVQYRSCAATPRYLYGLFDNIPFDSAGVSVDTVPLHVHAFHWSGRLSHMFSIDRDASRIVVSGDTLLFTATWVPDTVIRYRLPLD